MAIGLRLFLSSMTFGIVIAIAYWFCSHDATGTWLLGLMATGLAFAAGYMIFAERDAALLGDDGTAKQSDGTGERIGTFTLRSPWPACLAASVALFLGGMLVTPVFGIAGACAIVFVAWQLVRESR
jgi:Cytochrome c oxidase subunit IV